MSKTFRTEVFLNPSEGWIRVGPDHGFVTDAVKAMEGRSDGLPSRVVEVETTIVWEAAATVWAIGEVIGSHFWVYAYDEKLGKARAKANIFGREHYGNEYSASAFKIARLSLSEATDDTGLLASQIQFES